MKARHKLARKLVLILLGISIWPVSAFAYRPFDSTDAAVADLGELETELSPLSFRQDESGETWISPAARLNYGFAKDWEIVLEGQAEHPEHGRSALVESTLSFKNVLQEGSLQNKSGLSLAVEGAVLLPGINDQSNMGGGVTGIASQRWDWGSMHLNLGASRSREGRADIFIGTILEGPQDWTVRPAAELTYEHEFGNMEKMSVLAGLIWQASDKLAFDFGIRRARINSRPESEIRAGLTFAFAATDN